MGNDFPAAVCSSQAIAEKLIKTMIENGKKDQLLNPGPRIHWRWFEFEIDGGEQ